MSAFTEKHIWKLLEAYSRKNSLVLNQIESFDDFVNFGMQEVVDQESTISLPNYTARFGHITLASPQVIEEDRSLQSSWPNDARRRDLNYDAAILCDITETYIDGNDTKENTHSRVVIGRMPVMLRSSVCNLSKISEDECIQQGECPSDPGGYFVIKGNERVLVGQMRAVYNQVFVLRQKPGDKYKWIAETRSMSDETGHSVLLQAMVGNDDRTIDFSLPYIKEPIPAGVVFKALGYSENDITNLIGLDSAKAMRYIRFILRDSFFCSSQEEALNHISKYAMHIIAEDKKEDYAWQVVETETLPHLGISGSIAEQACFLGRMIRRLIMTHIGERTEDDRDNYANKRVETAGTLLYDIFRNLFKKYIQFIKIQLEKRKQRPDIVSIISRIKSITKGLHQCISTGNWGVQKNASYVRTGVSQILDRMTYCASLSHLRRVIIPMGKEGKNTAIRQIHGSSFGFVCPCECFDPETPILMWNGSVKTAKEIIVGDLLISDDGNCTRVKSTCSGFKEMYEISHKKKDFNNYTVTDNHILTLVSTIHKKISFCKKQSNFEVITLDKKNFSYHHTSFQNEQDAEKFRSSITEDSILDISVEEYLKLSPSIKNTLKAFKCSGINWPEQEVDLDPYVLGRWLGTSSDQELDTHSSGICFKDKHIPSQYLVNSRACRLQLLAGLIDTNGHVYDNGYEIQVPKRVSDECIILVRSLGFACYVNLGKSENCSNLIITGKNLDEIPIRMEHKKLSYPNLDREYFLQTEFTLTPKPLSPFVGWQLEGNGRFLLGDCTVTHNTPEGQKIGVVLNYALLAKITKKIPKVNVKNVLDTCKTIVPVEDMKFEDIKNFTAIFLNGGVIGFAEDPDETVRELRNKRSQGLIDRDVSVSYDVVDNDIRIFCDEGRFSRPLLTLDNNRLNIQGEVKYKWNTLVRKGIVQYVDAAEIENCVIAMTHSDLNTQHNDFCEIHPCTMLGIMAAMIPFSDHSQSPRNCYQSSMGKQALGVPALSYNLRTDTLLHVLHYPQRPLVCTKAAEIFGVNDMPSGINAIVAIAAYSGYNQEDSVMLNLSAIQRGMFCLTSYHTIDCCEKKRDTYSFEEICMPPRNSEQTVKQGQVGYFRRKNANYSLLDDQGIIRPREKFEKGQWVGPATVVKKGDVLIGKVVVTGGKSAEESKVDASVVVQPGEEGVIDRVHVMITPNGYKLVKIVIRVTREPTLGDKLASRAAQKGTIGMVYRQEDMPFTSQGITPDIIINPLCLSGDSAISVRGGSEQIDRVVKDTNAYSVQTVCPVEFTEQMTRISDPLVNDSIGRRMVRVQTWTGRSIVCTDDHPFLVGPDTWREAKDLQPNQDMLTILHSTAKLSEDGEIPELDLRSNNYGAALENFHLDEKKLQILARLLGAMETNGHLNIRNKQTDPSKMTFRTKFHLGEMKDVEDLSDDVYALGFARPTFRRVTTKKDDLDYCSTYNVDAAPALGLVLYQLGAHPGRKSGVAKVFPVWLNSASAEVQRQFLCGFQGGDGSYIGVNEKTVQQQVRIKPTKQTADNEFLECHKAYMAGISKLFATMGVNSTVCVEQPKDKNKKEVVLRISVKQDILEKYADLIDYSYCQHKQRRSRLPIEFLRLRNRGIRLPFEKMKEFQRGETIAVYVDKVEEVNYSGNVYDFATVSSNHSFVANSIVVHNCMPSRMTINQLIECALGKESAISGTYGDATPFTTTSVNAADKLVDRVSGNLKEYGFQAQGWETMYNGMTGEMINARIFIGPTYYQRLKHMVDDKMHARAQGHVTMLTRQPLEGVSLYIHWSTPKIVLKIWLQITRYATRNL